MTIWSTTVPERVGSPHEEAAGIALVHQNVCTLDPMKGSHFSHRIRNRRKSEASRQSWRITYGGEAGKPFSASTMPATSLSRILPTCPSLIPILDTKSRCNFSQIITLRSWITAQDCDIKWRILAARNTENVRPSIKQPCRVFKVAHACR